MNKFSGKKIVEKFGTSKKQTKYLRMLILFHIMNPKTDKL
jgi:hypothetical protein